MCERCKQARAVLARWTTQQGHDRCWYYPDLFRQLAETLGVELPPPAGLPPRAEFEAGCRRYQDEEYGGAHGP